MLSVLRLRHSIVVGIGIDTNSLDLEHILVTWWIPKGQGVYFPGEETMLTVGLFLRDGFSIGFSGFSCDSRKAFANATMVDLFMFSLAKFIPS